MEAARRAAAEELPRLVELTESARRELTGQRGGAQLAEEACGGATGLDDYVTGKGRSLWAGTLDDVVVGVAAVSVGRGDRGRFDLLYVEPGARDVGVGAALLEAGVGWLGQQGCGGVDVPALPGGRVVKQFLESEGLVARLIVMHRSIP